MARGRNPFPTLTRDQVPIYVRSHLRRGGGSRPALLVLEHDGEQVVVKDYRHSGWLMRALIGPWLVRREEYIYRLLQGSPGVPRLIGRVDRHALAVEHIDGRNCDHYRRGELPDAFFTRLQEVIEAMHGRGVVHCDVGNRRNIVVGAGAQPYIVDFASAFTSTGPFGPLRRFAFDRFRIDDLRGVAKARYYCGAVAAQRDRDFAFSLLPGERFARIVRDRARWLVRKLARR